MDYVTKQDKSGLKKTETSPIEDQRDSFTKNRISDILRTDILNSSNLEHAAKNAADEVIASSSMSTASSNNKQAISQKNHLRGILNSSSAITIPQQTQEDIENKLNADFSSVNYYQDDITTSSINAKAYTYGTDVVLSSKHYKPNTTKGNKLLAHELAHVIQQDKTGVMQVQRDEAKSEEIPTDQLVDYNDSLNEIMPSGGGLLHHIYITSILVDTFKDDKKIGALTRAIAADKDAKAITKEHGISGLMALHDANVNPKKAKELLESNKEFYTLDAIVQRSKNSSDKIIKDSLIKISEDSVKAAKEEKTYENIDKEEIKSNWALSLSKENMTNLKGIVPLLEQQKLRAANGEDRFKDSKGNLADAKDKITECRDNYAKAYRKGYGDSDALESLRDVRDELNQAKDDLALAISYGIHGLDKVFGELVELPKTVVALINDWRDYKKKEREKSRSQRKLYDLDLEKVSNIKEKIVDIKKTMADKYNALKGTDKSIERIHFLIRYFISLNDSSYDKIPTFDEMKKHVSKLDRVPEDLIKLTGGDEFTGFDLYKEIAVLIENQVKTRIGIKDKVGKDPGLQPSQGDIEKYFEALKDASNDEVMDAYRAYAGGFFQHRVEAPAERKSPPTLKDVYGMPVTIGGARMIVCAGYAELANKLFELAGAKPKGFIIQGHLTKQQIVDTTITEHDNLHIIAKFKRDKQEFYISNDSVYGSKDDAFALTNFDIDPNKTYHKLEADGKTAQKAGDNFIKEIKKKRKKLK